MYLKYITNPKVLAVPAAILLGLLLPLDYSQYQLKLRSQSTLPKYGKISYYDLKGDGNSNVLITNFKYLRPSVVINDHLNHVYTQWTLSGNWISKGMQLMFGDYDRNGLGEIFAFTFENDSVFLNGFEPYNKNGLNEQRIFIDRALSYRGDQDFNLVPGKLTDLNGDGYEEVVFAINAGYTEQPRNVYAYDLKNKQVLKSPKSGAFITNLRFSDLDHDQKEEILIDNYGPGNIEDSDFPFHDKYAWLIVLDHNLNFLFEPRPFEFPYSTAITWPYFDHETIYLVTSFDHYGTLNIDSELRVSNLKGETIRSSKTPRLQDKNNLLVTPEHPNRVLKFYRSGTLLEYDLTLQVVSEKLFKPTSERVKMVDLDQDGSLEFVGISYSDKGVQVIGNNLKATDHTKIRIGENQDFYFSSISDKSQTPQTALQIGNNHNILEYKPNPNRLWSYLAFFPLYLLCLVVIRQTTSIFDKLGAKKSKSEKSTAHPKQTGQKLKINTRTGFLLIDFNDILYCEADGNYTKLHLSNGAIEISTKNLGKLEPMLPHQSFKRINRSIIINSKYLYKVDRKKKVCSLHYQGKFVEIPLSEHTIKNLGADD